MRDNERLYFFQFPSPFPSFEPRGTVIDVDAISDAKSAKGKSVSWAPGIKEEVEDVKPDKRSLGRKPAPEVDGVIGRMDIYANGEVKIRLDEGVVMTVSRVRCTVQDLKS